MLRGSALSGRPLRAPAPPPRRRRRAPPPPPPRAALWTLPPDLAGALRTGVSIAAAVGIAFSALPILTGDSKERNERRFLLPDADEGADNLKWGVMSGLSLFPFLNPLVRGARYHCRPAYWAECHAAALPAPHALT